MIEPTKLSGTVKIPPSKSLAHRAVIAASLAKGRSKIENIQYSDDIIATIEAMTTLGAEIESVPVGDRYSLNIRGIGHERVKENRTIDANESGSTLRFLIPLVTLFAGQTRFVGRGQLGVRPLDTYENIFKEQGLFYKLSGTEKLDLTVEGQLKPGLYELEGNISSQFITGLLFTLPLLDEDSQIDITTELESVGYLDLTLDILKLYGIDIHFDRETRVFHIPGRQSYQATNYYVEGDYSQAAFFLCAGALGSDVTVSDLNLESSQGDKEIIPILKQLGATITKTSEGLKAESDQLIGNTTIDGAQCPDIIPVVAAVAALSKGKTKIINLHRLRIKESDRLEATKNELNKLGAKIKVIDDRLEIEGSKELKGNTTVWSHKDHRIAMMEAIASTVCQEKIIITDSECVAKSYPTFWEDFVQLGGRVNEWHLGK